MSHYPNAKHDEGEACKEKPEAFTAVVEDDVEVPGAMAPHVDPLSQRIFDCMPCVEHVPILGPILKAYSPGLVVAIGLERLFVKGVIHSLMRKSIQPMLTERYGLTAAQYQRLSSLYTLGWSVNSFFSAFADTFAIFGYTKRWYCVLCSVGGGVFGLLYALLPGQPASAQPAAAFMFLMALFLANVDTFAAAVYSRRIRANPASGAAMVSWAWAMSHMGAIVGSSVQGPLSDNDLTQVGVYIASAVLFLLSFMFIFNILGEAPNRVCRLEDAKADYIAQRRAERAGRAQGGAEAELAQGAALTATHSEPFDEEAEDADDLAGFEAPVVRSYLWGAIELNKEVVTRNWLMIVYCLLLTAAVVATAVVTILGTHWDMLYNGVVVAVVVCGAAFLTLPLVVAKAATFIFFFQILYLNLPGVTSTFYVAKPKCLPSGPHFSYTFYNITSGIIGDISSVAGIIIFSNYCQKYSYRAIMSVAAIMYPVISIFDLMMINRWNMYIGIPDHAMYIFGDALLYDIVDYLLRMPMFLLISRVAPRGSESMVIALLDSVLHVGSTTSTAVGYILLETIWPIKSKGKCDYHNAQWLIIAGHMVAPLLIMPLAFLLLPSASVSATLDERGNAIEEIMLPAEKSSVGSLSSDNTAATERPKNTHYEK